MSSERDSSDCYNVHVDSKWKIKNGLHILHLNLNSLLPKTDEFRYTTKQPNAT